MIKIDVTYLAVEKDNAVHERESAFWLSRGASVVKVTSMTKAIKEAMKNKFLYIGINASNINYKPQLPILREATNDPIFISTTTYSMQEQGLAISLGADLFGQISENPHENYDTVMANIHGLEERSKRQLIDSNLFPYANILLVPEHHKVFVDDIEVELTKIEFDLLHFFMENCGHVLSPVQLYDHVWKSEHIESVDDVVRSAIKRLRRKISGHDNSDIHIENVKDVGYRLPEILER